MGLNATEKVSWSTFGKKLLKMRVTYTNNDIFYAYSTLNLVQTPNYQAPGAKNYNAGWNDNETIGHPDPALSEYGINLQIEYACGNDKIIKPFIYVEGFSPHEYFDGFDNETYIEFFEKFTDYEDENMAGYQLLDELETNGYDIIYVDFQQGTGNILENAQTLKKAIKWINDEKAANGSSEPNVVAGYSMGGLVARVAIRQMELELGQPGSFGAPDVSYFITVDTPHLGANIPLAIALAVDDMHGLGLTDYSEKLQNAYELLNSPAAKQMLFYAFDKQWVQVTPNLGFYTFVDAQLRTEFMQELDDGLPLSTVENIAIAKGNGQGNSQGYTGVAELISVEAYTDYNCFDAILYHPEVEFLDGAFVDLMIKITISFILNVFEIGGTTFGVEMDINALPGGEEQFEIYRRAIHGELIYGLINFSLNNRSIEGVGNPYDSAPGGHYDISNFTGAGEDLLEDIINNDYAPCIDIHQTKFGFIPTVSALNIPSKVDDPFAQIDPVAIVVNGETEFDRAFILDPTLYSPPSTAPVNESHTVLTPSNVGPFEEFINVDYYPSEGISTLTNTTLNYGFNDANPQDVIKTTNRILGSLTISGTGTPAGGICINCNGNLEIIDDNSFPVNLAASFDVSLLSDCSNNQGHLIIDENGFLRVGENNLKTGRFSALDESLIELRDGVIEVRPNSKLVIGPGSELRLTGGVLRVMNGGQVIIKEGGLLRYEDGATIELNGNDAQLVLEGLTYIGDDAEFDFSYTGTESGYIRLVGGTTEDQKFLVGNNARIDLKGEDKDDLILYLEEDADFAEFLSSFPYQGQTFNSQEFDRVHFTDGKILFNHNSRIALRARAKFSGCTIGHDIVNSPTPSRGIVNYKRLQVFFCDLTKVDVNSLLHFEEDGAFVSTNSNYHEMSILVRGFGYSIRDCVFDEVGIQGEQATISNQVLRCDFINDSELVDFSLTELLVSTCTFDNNIRGIFREYGRVTARCSEFTNNGIGIEAGKESTVNMSTYFNGGYNHFDDNNYNIQLFKVHDLLLDEGYNELYDANIFNIHGTLDQSLNSCPKTIYAYNNIWTPASGGGPITDPDHPDSDEFEVYVGDLWPNDLCQAVFKFGPVADIARCGEHDPPQGPGPSKSSENPMPLVVSENYFDSLSIDLALKDVASRTTVSDTVTGDDLLAANMYFELLISIDADTLPNDSIRPIVDKMLWNALYSYKAAVERLLLTDDFSPEQNEVSFQPEIQDYVSVLMQYTDSVKSLENYHDQFMLEMAKTSLFRTLNKPEKSLQILVNINDCEHDSLQQLILDYMIQNVEYDIEASFLGVEASLYDSLYFTLDSSLYEIPLSSFTDTTGFGTYINGPNSLNFTECTEYTFASISTGNSRSGAENFYNVYPNPTNNQLVVERLILEESEAGIENFELYDLSGRLVFQAPIPRNVNDLSLPDLNSALYIFMIRQESQEKKWVS